jgi:hypothetical protein
VEVYIRNKNSYQGKGEFIGRPSPLSNPIHITEDISRETAVYEYSKYIKKEIRKRSPKIIFELERLFSILIKEQRLNLICFCSPKLCHGHLLKEILLNKIYYGYWLVDDYIGMQIGDKKV